MALIGWECGQAVSLCRESWQALHLQKWMCMYACLVGLQLESWFKKHMFMSCWLGWRTFQKQVGPVPLPGSMGVGLAYRSFRSLSNPTTLNSFCKGRTLHSFVRDPKISLDINKTRQIAQEIIKVKAELGRGVPAASRALGPSPGHIRLCQVVCGSSVS